MLLQVASAFTPKAVAILAIITTVAVLLCYFMYRRTAQMQRRLHEAQRAAEEAARAAALAAPGGIDPEIVLAILNQGLPPTLDNVYTLTRQREQQLRAQAGTASPA